MPHQCTDCGTTFADGSTEMLSGCPDCGGNTFQFLPESSAGDSSQSSGAEPEPTPDSEPAPSVDRSERPSPGDSVAKTVGNAAKTVKDIVGSDPDGPGTSPEAADPLEPWPEEGPGPTDDQPDGTTPTAGAESTSADRQRRASASRAEDVAQTSARSAVVAPEELPESGTAEMAAGAPPADGSPSPSDSRVEGSETEPSDNDEIDRPGLEELREELNDQFESIRIVEPGQYELNLMELYEREEYIIALQEDGRYQIQVPESW
ncbi:OapC/ArvC family zinc-ribbon domain-containing protein [Halorhabdus amylolytica]|uniref:OapC/ArvC family zinc-ribbon domain-containing protein n=1 Tax=Halorhabdus amylolytica TaxID=2559573 RepID=UPI0010AAF297|nr:Zn-ribbon containing protein [Halorhabdus amylolytica]